MGFLGVRKQPLIALHFEFESVLKFYNLQFTPHQVHIEFVYPQRHIFFIQG